MNNFNKWISRHGFLAMLIAVILFWSAGTLLMFVSESISLWWIIFYVLTFLLSLLISYSAKITEMNNAIKILWNFCDPYPMLQEMSEQLSYVKSKKYKTLLLINKAVAIGKTGDFETNLKILKDINIEEQGFSLIFKAIYFNNLADAYISVKDFENAKKYLEMTEQIIPQLKNEKNRHILKRSYNLNLVSLKISEGDFESAITIINSTNDINESKHLIVEKSLLWAQIYIGAKRFNEADRCLKYVINNGNRLYAVTEAYNLMNKKRENVI